MIATAPFASPAPHARATSAISMAGMLGFYFAFRVCITFLLFQSDPPTGAAVNVALNILLLLPVALYSFGPGMLTFRKTLSIWPVRYVLAFLGLALLSLLWSETSSKAIALGYWIALASDVILVLFIARTDGATQASESLLKGYIYGVALLCLVAWAAPAMQDLRLGDDEFLTPNAIGFECAFGTLLCQYFAPQGARWKWLGAALAITLVRSLSKTSIAAFVVVEAFYLLRTRTISRAGKAAIALGALAVTAAFSSLITRYYALYLNTGTSAETLTGRTSIWLVTFGYAWQKPWLGYGFHSYRTVIPPFGPFQPWHAHNEFLQQFFAYGLAGVVLVATLYLSFFRLCRHHRQHPLALTGIALLLLTLIRGLTDTERFDITFPLWAITAVSLAIATERRSLA
jgi:exopolysaccharide production protein ExoQ